MKAAPTGSSALGLQGCRLCPLTPICKPTPRTRGLRKVSKHSPHCPMCSPPGTARRMAQSVHPPGTNPSRSLPRKCHGLLYLYQGSPPAPVPPLPKGTPLSEEHTGITHLPQLALAPATWGRPLPCCSPRRPAFPWAQNSPAEPCLSFHRPKTVSLHCYHYYTSHVCVICVPVSQGRLTTWGGYALSSRPACFRDPGALKATHD